MFNAKHISVQQADSAPYGLLLVIKDTKTGDYLLQLPETVKDDGELVSTGSYKHVLALDAYEKRVKQLKNDIPNFREERSLATVLSMDSLPQVIPVSVEPREEYQQYLSI